MILVVELVTVVEGGAKVMAKKKEKGFWDKLDRIHQRNMRKGRATNSTRDQVKKVQKSEQRKYKKGK